MIRIRIAIICLISLLPFSLRAEKSEQAERINLSFQNVEIKDLLKEIKSQTQYDFIYNINDLNDKNTVSIEFKDADIETVLKSFLDPLNVDFTINKNIIVLQKKINNQQDKQTFKTVKGKVVDKTKLPIPGATVTMKGTAIGVSTNADGEFQLSVPDVENIELIFTFIGMNSVTYKVMDDKEITIIMEENVEALEEVVVTGMQTIKRDQMTGSATVITAKDIRMQGITSIDRILEGMVAGMNSTTVSGQPGTRTKITIRGENNLSSYTEPLWIVDGLPLLSGVPESNTVDYAGTIMQDGIGNIQPEDIESITILKDASATAIYGARAANGVIVITTKKGFRSKTQISYSGSYEVGLAPNMKIDFMNTAEKLRYEKSIVDNFGINYANSAGRGGYFYKRFLEGYITESEYNSEIEKLSRNNTDWFDVIFRAAHSHQHNLSFRGGSEEMSYYTSLNFQQKSGILKPNKYESVNAKISLDYRPLDNLIMSFDVSASSRNSKNHASEIDPFKYAVYANPYERPYNDDGSYAADLSYLSRNYTTETASGYVFDSFNILRELNDTKDTQTGLDATMQFILKYTFIPGFSFETHFQKGYSYNMQSIELDAGTHASWRNEIFAREAYNLKNYYNVLPDQYNNGELTESSGKNNYWSIRNQVDFSKTILDDHLFTVLFANEVISKKFNNFGYTSPIYYADYRITGMPTFDNGTLYSEMTEAYSKLFRTSDGQDRSVSFVGSLRYSYKDKYVANFNYRADGADVIGKTKRFTPLWSVGARYNLHREDFLKNTFVNELAIRGSYGYTGNIDRTAYPFSTISFGSTLYMGDRFATEFTFPNPTVTWEKKTDRNIGLEAAFFNNRISFTAEYYSNKTKNVLSAMTLAPSTGRDIATANGGIVENKGVELDLSVRWIYNDEFTFTTGFNISRNKNVIVKSYYDYQSYSDYITGKMQQGGSVNIVGKETQAIYGWKSAGVNPKTGNPRYYLTEDAKRDYSAFIDKWDSYSDYQKEEYLKMIPSLNEIPDVMDFLYNQTTTPEFFINSMQYLGRANPKYVGGFNTYIRYKGIEFTTNWTFKTGHIIPIFNDYQNAPGFGDGEDYINDFAVSNTNRERKYLNYWQYYGDQTDVRRFITSGHDTWSGLATTEKYSKGDYLRMTNLSLSYRLPSHVSDYFKLRYMSLGFSARNLLTFTKYRGLDVGTQGAFNYPVSREFNFKLSIGI